MDEMCVLQMCISDIMKGACVALPSNKCVSASQRSSVEGSTVFVLAGLVMLSKILYIYTFDGAQAADIFRA